MRATAIAIAVLAQAAFASTNVSLPVPPRRMWGWGDGLRGYCGSFSFQSFGLLFGNYVTAEVIRNSADGHELLIGVNEEIAAKALHFDYDLWPWSRRDDPQYNEFLGWIADHIDEGHGVVAGFFEQKLHGDEDYDHIMPVFGYARDDSQFRHKAPRSDVLGIWYNDLFRNYSLFGDVAGGFVRDRSACKPDSGIDPRHAPYNFCLPKRYDYAIALKGNVDFDRELVSTRLEMPSWTEPDYGKEDGLHQGIVTFEPTLVLEGLEVGSRYAVLRFDHPSAVPDSKFEAGAYSKRFEVTATSTTMSLKEFDSFPSDSTVFYRTIRVVS